MLNVSRLLEHLEDAEQRRRVAYSFREPDRVPICIGDGGNYWARLFGYNVRDYYTDLDVMIEVQEKGLQWRFENLRDDRTDYAVVLDLGPICEALVFGCPIEYPDNASPKVVHTIEDIGEIEKLQIVEPLDNPGVEWYLGQFRLFQRAMEKRKSVFQVQSQPALQIRPPLSTACAIMDPSLVYSCLVDEPGMMILLMDRLLRVFCMLMDHFDDLNGVKSNTMRLVDDDSCLVSARLYRDVVLPYAKAIYERYGAESRYLHVDGPCDQLFPVIAEELDLTLVDIGGRSSLEEATKHLKWKTVIHGGLGSRDLCRGLDVDAKAKVDRAICLAAPGGGYEFAIGGRTHPGVAPDTLVELVDYVKARGRYPIEAHMPEWTEGDEQC